MQENQRDSVDNSQGKRYLSIPEIAQETGCSVAFWRKAIFPRKIPFVKIGRSVRISREDFETWLQTRRREAEQ